MLPSSLFPAFVLCAASAILAAPWALDTPLLAWVGKPLATALVIAAAWTRVPRSDARRNSLLAGLALSWLGDVALLWPQGFLAGLVAFLLAHLAYLWTFTRRAGFAAWPVVFVGYFAVAGGIAAWIWPGVPGPMRVPVLLYVGCLASMAAQAAVQWRVLRAAGDAAAAGALLAAIGGALFVVSDALLAINRFRSPLPAASLWILASYWAAQWLIASSMVPRAAPKP